MRRSATTTLVDTLATDPLPKQRMMAIMNGYKLADMGIMTLRWPWAEKTGYLQARCAVVSAPPTSCR